MLGNFIWRLFWLSICVLAAGCVVPGGSYYTGDDASSTCSFDSECDFDEFCYQSNCERALGREYQVTILSGVAASGDNEAPDLSVTYGVSRDGEWSEVCETLTVDDTWFPTWDHACSFVISEGQVLEMEVWDDDVFVNDLYLTARWEGVDELVGLIRDSGIELVIGNDSVDIYFRIDPLF